MQNASEATWTSPRGFCRRIDYIVVPQAWRSACARPRVDSNFVTLSVDHRPVCLDIQASLVDSPPRKIARALPRHSHPFCAANLDTMRMALWAMPPVVWNANVHSHTAYVYEAVKLGAKEAGLFEVARRTRKFVSEEAARLLQAAKSCKRRLRQLDRLQTKLRLREAFGAWKRDATVAVSREGWTISDVCRQVAYCLAEQKAVSKRLRWRIRYDKGAYAARALEDMQQAATPFAAKAFFRALRCLRPAGKRVLKPFGRLQITPFAEGEECLAVRQQRHFAAIEAGDVIDVASYLGHDSQAAHPRPKSVFDPTLLPTLLQLEGLFRGAKQGKAPGPNGIPEWIWALDSRAAARAFLPVFLKAHFRLTEPVQFKSTALIALFKGKGSPAVLANHRAIALLDGPGKALRRSLRPALVSLLPPPDQQQGGTPGSLLAGAHHLVRAHQQLALGLKSPSVALFLDVSSAYYRVLRQSFGEGDLEHDEDIVRLLSLLKVPPSALHEVCDWLSGTNLLAEASSHCTALIRVFLSGTFFRIQGAPGIVRTRAGSRPGDSIADLLFSLVQADFLQAVRTRIGGLAASDPVLASLELPISSVIPVWADDAVVLLAQHTTQQLLQAAAHTLEAVHSEYTRRAMAPNYAPGKSEALFSFKGPGAPAARQELYIRQAGIFPFHVRGTAYGVHCVRAYTHLGGRVCDTGRFMPDVAQHISAAWAQVRPLARHVLRNPTLRFAKRRLILNSLAFSAASGTAATWGPLNSQEARAWRIGYVRLVRLLGRDDRHTGQPSLPSESDVCKAFRFPSPLAFLRAERILHAARLLLTQSTLWDVLRAAYRLLPETWLHVLRGDLEWLVSICPRASPFLCDFPDGFAEQALHAPSALRGAVRAAKAWVLHPEHEPRWHDDGPADGALSDGRFSCEQCPAAFATAQQLSAHRFGKHGIRCQAAQYAGHTTVCKSCLMQFWEPHRLLRHLQHDSPHCLTAQEEHQLLEGDLGAWGTPSPPPAPGLPATRLQGPRLPLLSCSVADFAASLMAEAEPAVQRGWLSPACRLWLDASRST